MKVGLVGNQNSGKTTLFNLLTGMNAKIGNWPGVTIEQKRGMIKNTNYEIVDLPGIYSLSPYSVEEEISRKFIFDEKPDVIINIVDGTSLERSLYLTTQLLELDTKIIVALNMVDVIEKRGIKIDVEQLQKILGVKVIKISALKGTGIDDLVKEIGNSGNARTSLIYDESIEKTINNIVMQLPQRMRNKRFIAVKLLEDDERFETLKSKDVSKIALELSKKYDVDFEEVIATQRYKFIEMIKARSYKRIKSSATMSDKLDKIFLNRWLGIPLFIGIMFSIYYLSVGIVGKTTVNYVEKIVSILSINVERLLINIDTSKWLVSLVVDGIITGVGAVLNFVPQLVILFMCISILETTGYMSRIALLLDKLFRKIGLSGKSLIPFIVGSGCSVPGIVGTRIIENNDEREMTVVLTPFIPCSAKLPIIALFSGYFFDENSGFVAASLYFLAIIIIIISSITMKKFVYKNTSSMYISELPEYKLPSLKYMLKDVWQKTTSFVKRAGSIILICSIIIWILLSFSVKFEYDVDVENSMLASIGRVISPIFYPLLGVNNWKVTVSAIQGLVAKEQVVSSMSVIAGFATNASEQQIFTNASAFDFFTPASAYAFMIFNLFSAPCFAAICAMRRELGSIKKVLKALAFQTALAWCISTIVYQVWSRIEEGIISCIDVVIGVLLIIVIVIPVGSRKSSKYSICTYCKSCNRKC